MPRLSWAAGIRDLCPRPPPMTGKALSVSSGPRPGLMTAAPHPHQVSPARSLHELQRICPPPLRSSPPGQDSPHHSRSSVRHPRAQGHLGLYPRLPEAAGTTLLLQTPHVIHRLSKLSQLEASCSLTSAYTSDQESRVLTLKQKCRSRRQDRNRRENPHTYGNLTVDKKRQQ